MDIESFLLLRYECDRCLKIISINTLITYTATVSRALDRHRTVLSSGYHFYLSQDVYKAASHS